MNDEPDRSGVKSAVTASRTSMGAVGFDGLYQPDTRDSRNSSDVASGPSSSSSDAELVQQAEETP